MTGQTDPFEHAARLFEEEQQWRAACTLGDLGELTAQWLEGTIVLQPHYDGGPELTVDIVTHIKAEISLVGFWRNDYVQNTLRAWVATRLAEPMIDGEDLFDFTRTTPIADRLVELAKANHARLVTG